MTKIFSLPRGVLTGAIVCALFMISSLSSCNKETVELDVKFVEAGANRTFTTPITEIAFGNSGKGLLVTGNRKKLYKTTDYGVTWVICTTFTASSCFLDQLRYSNNGNIPYFVYHPNSSGAAHLYTNLTGGNNSWLDQITTNGAVMVHSFYNSSSGYAYCRLPSQSTGFAQTTDFGVSYTYLGTCPTIGPFLQFTSATNGYAIINTNDFAVTTNSGTTWSVTHTSCKYNTKVSPNGTCFLISENNQIYKSTNYGATWNLCFSDPGGNYYGAIDFSEDGLVVASTWGQLLCSRDGGASWKYLKLSDENALLERIIILSDGTVCATAGSTVCKYSIPEVL